jgi:outer membrane immunogenic protein
MFKTLIAATALLIAGVGAASAADVPMPVKAPPAAAYNWAGFYIGGDAGYGWGRSTTEAHLLPGTGGLIRRAHNKFDMNNWIAGGQIGYNWQQANWIFGFEADAQATGEKGRLSFLCSAACIFIPPGSSTALNQKLEWFSTLRSRTGYAFFPTAMWYLTGDVVFAGIRSDTSYFVPNVGTGTGSRTTTRAGWTLGTGTEFQLVGNWTGKVEYLYMDLGHFTFGDVFPFPAASAGTRINYNSHLTDHILRAGVNYRF